MTQSHDVAQGKDGAPSVMSLWIAVDAPVGCGELRATLHEILATALSALQSISMCSTQRTPPCIRVVLAIRDATQGDVTAVISNEAASISQDRIVPYLFTGEPAQLQQLERMLQNSYSDHGDHGDHGTDVASERNARSMAISHDACATFVRHAFVEHGEHPVCALHVGVVCAAKTALPMSNLRSELQGLSFACEYARDEAAAGGAWRGRCFYGLLGRFHDSRTMHAFVFVDEAARRAGGLEAVVSRLLAMKMLTRARCDGEGDEASYGECGERDRMAVDGMVDTLKKLTLLPIAASAHAKTFKAAPLKRLLEQTTESPKAEAEAHTAHRAKLQRYVQKRTPLA